MAKLLNKKIEKKKKIVVVEDDSIKFKPIVWSAERNIDVNKLLEAPSKDLLIFN